MSTHFFKWVSCILRLIVGEGTMNVLFWDIDGTLLQTGKAGLYAFEQVFDELQGERVNLSGFNAGGRTDNYICQQLLYRATGRMPDHEEVRKFCHHYEKLLLQCLEKTEGEVFEPIRTILPFFQKRSDYVQLLLTGNSDSGAFMKLKHYGLEQYFDFKHSGFACDYYYRDDMARHALELVQKEWGDQLENLYVIGDTPYDIQCGKAIGAYTIAVATGHYPLEKLQEHDPWWLVPRLPAPEVMLEKLQSVR